ncbi:MAG: type II/IV secretion system protein [Candidatus Omnitrophota bacterium]|nr:MAG: type II/IV secretion system protein [Candidatus Omnitrophota bacterium]
MSRLLGEILIDKGLIDAEQLNAALTEQEGKKGEFIGELLVEQGFLSVDELLPVLSEQLNIAHVKLKQAKIDPEIIKLVPAKIACHYKLIPLKKENDILYVAVSDPLDVETLDDLRLILKIEVKSVLAAESDILEAIRKYYGVGADTIETMEIEPSSSDNLETFKVSKEDLEGLAQDASIVRFVNQILMQALNDRATDIHIEPFEDQLRVRFRIDGVLYDASVPSNIKFFHSAIVSRIKVMANLDIAERRLPQDGRIVIRLADKDLDLRISVLPTPYGETVDIRILVPGMLFSLKDLGLLESDLKILESLIKKPHGIVFVTGPTGSGKTTTLYACLTKINDAQKKIITIEDPIEYQIKGVTQVQIQPKINLSFAQGLRSMLRHDPDIMMVGEVRDRETADITIRVALTGHLVFSTLHTNDAAGGVARLLDIGIEPYLVASSVECFIAQRLVRLICPKCKHEVKLEEDMLQQLQLRPEDVSGIKFYAGRGCEFCKFTGYRGRTGIYEFLLIDERIRELILQRVSADQMKKAAVSAGMHTLRQDGWEKIKMGLTTPAEVVRVTQQEQM